MPVRQGKKQYSTFATFLQTQRLLQLSGSWQAQCCGSGSASGFASICKRQAKMYKAIFKVLSLYLEARIRIRIKVKGRIRTRIKVASRIRIRIKVKSRMRIRNTAAAS
jgi:hypothetical protein